MKAKLLLVLVFSCICISGFSQRHNELYDIINSSFEEYIKVENEYHKYRIEERMLHENTPLLFNNIYISLENYPLGFEFNQHIQNLGFKYLYMNSSAAMRVFKKPCTVIFIIGPTITADKLAITFSPRTVIRKGNNVIINSSLWVTSNWKYSPEIEKWELINVESGGI